MHRLVVFVVLCSCATAPVEEGRGSASATCYGQTDCPKGFSCAGGACVLGSSGTEAKIAQLMAQPQCLPCKADDECSSDGSAGCWLKNTAGKHVFCGIDCTLKACPTGLTCLADAGATTKTCHPRAGLCPRADEPEPLTCDDTWAGFAQAKLTASCGNCHAFATSLTVVQPKAADIRARLSDGTMPPKEKLPGEVIDRLVDWIDCGLKP